MNLSEIQHRERLHWDGPERDNTWVFDREEAS